MCVSPSFGTGSTIQHLRALRYVASVTGKVGVAKSPGSGPHTPRSVALRTEIGPLPARDRSQPASRLSCAVHLGRCLRTSQWVRRSPLVLCNRANEAVGRARGSMMRRWARFSSVLHMGAGPWPLLTVLFRMIPRFPPTPSARECATHTTPGHASTSPGLRVVRVNMRATPGPRRHRDSRE